VISPRNTDRFSEAHQGKEFIVSDQVMGRISHVRLLIVGAALATALVAGIQPGHAATGGTLLEFNVDPVLTSTTTSVTSSQAFPDGSSTAACFIQVDAKGAQSKTMGNCAGTSLITDCTGGAFALAPSADVHGAALVMNGVRTQTGARAEDFSACGEQANGVRVGLSAKLTGYTAGSKLVFYFNNDATAQSSGCATFGESTTFTAAGCFANTSTLNNGTFYEVTGDAGGSGTIYETTCASFTTGGCLANANLGGVFILATGVPAATGTAGVLSGTATPHTTGTTGSPLAAFPVTLSRSHGVTHLSWYSDLLVKGFNVVDGQVRLNRHVVTSTTGHYHFNTKQRIHDLRLQVVPLHPRPSVQRTVSLIVDQYRSATRRSS
jgi:hypothetical protein